MQPEKIRIGQVYVDVPRPRHEWRVTERRDDSFTLERVDKSTVFRFVSATDLCDTTLYVCTS